MDRAVIGLRHTSRNMMRGPFVISVESSGICDIVWEFRRMLYKLQLVFKDG